MTRVYECIIFLVSAFMYLLTSTCTQETFLSRSLLRQTKIFDKISIISWKETVNSKNSV